LNDQERIEQLIKGLRQNTAVDMCIAIAEGLHNRDERIDPDSTASALMQAGRMAIYRPRWWAFFTELIRVGDELADQGETNGLIREITDITLKYPAVEYDEMMHVFTEMADEGIEVVLDNPETSCYPRTVELLAPTMRLADTDEVLTTLKSALEETVGALRASIAADQTPDKEEGEPEA